MRKGKYPNILLLTHLSYIGLIVILALAYLGTKIYKQVSGKGGCGCGSGGSKKSSSCGGNCSCDGSNKALGIKRTAK
ncbi:MAG: FeoB-associated Cys-rich membrane protein [Veillonella sp.]|nr:FeoB-associated Cys-rich membrane protein [Veillonella sp.]MDU4009128.1 FeoB-associated Cys-rich membrane protein [Veillonella sp.]